MFNIVALIEAGDAKRLLEQVDPNEELVSRNRTFNIDGDEGWAYNDYAGYSVLHEAAKQGNTELCRELVFAGADWNKECSSASKALTTMSTAFRNELGMKPIDFASNRETKSFLNNAENELRAHNRSKFDELLPAANAWKPPEGGFAADAQRQVGAAMKAHGQDGRPGSPSLASALLRPGKGGESRLFLFHILAHLLFFVMGISTYTKRKMYA